MTGTVPAPEARVRAYVDAQAEEDARTGYTSDEIAWAVPDEGRLTALAIGDLRDILAELASWRTAASSHLAAVVAIRPKDRS